MTKEKWIEWVRDGSWRVRHAAALDPNIPLEAVQILLNDDNVIVLATLCRNTAMPHQILNQLAQHGHWSVRRAVASNTNLPLPTLLQLCKDRDPVVRCAAVMNPHILYGIWVGDFGRILP